MDARTHTHTFCDPPVAQSTSPCLVPHLFFLSFFVFFLSLSSCLLTSLSPLRFPSSFALFPPFACFSTFRLAIALSDLTHKELSLFKLTAFFPLLLLSTALSFLCPLFPLSLPLSLCVCSVPLCGTMSLSLLSLCFTFSFPSLPPSPSPCPFLGYQTIFPAMRLVTPPPSCPLPPSPASSSCSSCGRAPIREMITLRHSVIWRRRAAAARTRTHTELFIFSIAAVPKTKSVSFSIYHSLPPFFSCPPSFPSFTLWTRDLDVCVCVR